MYLVLEPKDRELKISADRPLMVHICQHWNDQNGRMMVIGEGWIRFHDIQNLPERLMLDIFERGTDGPDEDSSIL